MNTGGARAQERGRENGVFNNGIWDVVRNETREQKPRNFQQIENSQALIKVK